MTLPGSPHIAYRGDDLFIESQSLRELAQRFGTPLYVYSQRAMLDAVAAYRSALVNRPHLLCYAMKANPMILLFTPPINHIPNHPKTANPMGTDVASSDRPTVTWASMTRLYWDAIK
mgnify:CR=1 FL=1